MSALILALNPSIDAEWRVADVLWEEKNNVQSERRWAGGKGINVARWLKYLGGRPQLLLPLGGPSGQELVGCLRREKISARLNVTKGAFYHYNEDKDDLVKACFDRSFEIMGRMIRAAEEKPSGIDDGVRTGD